jgi:xylulokinase
MQPVGFHRYVIQDFMSEQEVEEFDPPVVCTVWEYFSYADVVHKTSVQKTFSFAGSSIDFRPAPLHASSC